MNATVSFPRHLNFEAVLTPRESEIVEVLAKGYSKKEVPDLIHPTKSGEAPSVHTVTNISKSIYTKTGAQKASEITIWWFVRTYKIPITVLFFALFCTHELAGVQTDLRSLRRTRRNEYEFVTEE